ncbi:M48 family metallopeptidase [Sphingobacterium humi]|uniref:M48 family metalloprotease n=1 Tax=Sphingobacterium humi TaxID=1796905 RepID=A0A6N8KXJ6_9SPHI|nr:M48 family metallopeptidase [Sphingobacterium humi]MVZ61807.1 M48 family metalloprotease [Sphingobacterium humi]
MKTLGKFLFVLAAIAAVYFILFQVNWEKLFKLEEKQERLEEKLGKLINDELKASYGFIDDDSSKQVLDSIFSPLLEANGIARKKYKLMLIKDSEVNAFALPNNQIVLTSGIINFLDSADYLSAVLAHELAHCEKKHVMKSLITNFGLDVLLSGSGASEVTNFLTGQAFSRKLEQEADEQAVDYLTKADIDPKNLIHVMELFDLYLTGDLDLTWASTHPAPKDRKAYLQQKINNTAVEDIAKPSLSQEQWEKFQEHVEKQDGEVD